MCQLPVLLPRPLEPLCEPDPEFDGAAGTPEPPDGGFASTGGGFGLVPPLLIAFPDPGLTPVRGVVFLGLAIFKSPKPEVYCVASSFHSKSSTNA